MLPFADINAMGYILNMKNNIETFGQRLRKYRGKETQATFAKKLKIAQSYLSELERDEKSPSRELLSSISKESGYSISYWMSEIDAPTPFFTCDSEAPQLIEDSLNTTQLDNVIFIPIVSNKIVTACCGDGSPYATDVQWEVADHFPMPASELIGYTWQGAKYAIMTADGSSMEPFIRSGEKVLFAEGIDLGIGDVGVFSLNGRLLIRGLIKKNGVYVLRAHNWKEYQDLEIDIKTGDFFVIGKVLKVVSARSVPPVL